VRYEFTFYLLIYLPTNAADAGQVDDATIHMMRMPRCGVTDVQSMGNVARRRKRYATLGTINIYDKNFQGEWGRGL